MEKRMTGSIRRIRHQGFTLLEIVIVIIIIAVLSALALPRMFKLVKCGLCAEATVNFSTIRLAMDRCMLMTGEREDTEYCGGGFGEGISSSEKWQSLLGLENPGSSPGSHFEYFISPTVDSYRVFAYLKPITSALDVVWVQYSNATPLNIGPFGYGDFENCPGIKKSQSRPPATPF
jgi:prepilin-type N-terminal cleavage/methylation domain-containing protein